MPIRWTNSGSLAAKRKPHPIQYEVLKPSKSISVKARLEAKKALQEKRILITRTLPIFVAEMRAEFGLSQTEMSRVTGYSLRSIAGWESGKTLSDSARQKLAETKRLLIALGELIPPGELGAWMRSSNPAFEGQTPIQVIERGQSDRVWLMIFQIEANVAT